MPVTARLNSANKRCIAVHGKRAADITQSARRTLIRNTAGAF